MIELIHGDCFILNDSISSESIDLIVTDPPYGMDFQSGSRKIKERKIQNDDNVDWLPEWMRQQFRVLKNNSHAYVFCSWHKIEFFKAAASAAGFAIKNILIWEKPSLGMGDLTGAYGGGYEMILFLHKGRRELTGNRISDVIKAKRTGNLNHPTEKPVNLIRLFIEKSSSKGDLILDNFLGSGSTAIACHDLGRRFIGHEIDEERYKLAVKRVNQSTSQITLF